MRALQTCLLFWDLNAYLHFKYLSFVWFRCLFYFIIFFSIFHKFSKTLDLQKWILLFDKKQFVLFVLFFRFFSHLAKKLKYNIFKYLFSNFSFFKAFECMHKNVYSQTSIQAASAASGCRRSIHVKNDFFRTI